MPQSFRRKVIAPLPKPALLGVRGHSPPGLFARQPRKFAGVFQDSVIAKSFLHARRNGQRAIHRTDDRPNRDAIFRAEFKIALIMRRHRHDGAGAVAHQHEIRHPDGHALLAERIDGIRAGEKAFFFQIVRSFVGARIHHGFGAGASVRIGRGCDQRMLRRQDHAGRAVDRIDARGEDANRPELRGEIDFRAFGAPDPVALHREHALRPTRLRAARYRSAARRRRRWFAKTIVRARAVPLASFHDASSSPPPLARWRARWRTPGTN